MGRGGGFLGSEDEEEEERDKGVSESERKMKRVSCEIEFVNICVWVIGLCR